MDPSVDWSHGAERDLSEAAAYLVAGSEAYAAAFAREILAATRLLEDMTELGRVVPEFGRDDIRELIVGNYRVIYHVTRGRVTILALVHGRRDLRRAVRSRLPR